MSHPIGGAADGVGSSGVGSADVGGPPILQHREALLAAIAAHDCLIVVGDTGSGKTTHLPRILRAAGCERVCVTQPRRVAAIMAARRVADEMGTAVGGKEVGYAVRFERACTEHTRITFATDGTVLRQAVAHPELELYDALVLDEAHERSLATDVLFALAKRVLTRRRTAAAAANAGSAALPLTEGVDRPTEDRSPLPSLRGGGLQRVVVASATLDADRLSTYLLGAPIYRVAGRSFPVTIRHAADPATCHSLVEAALELVLRIHTQPKDGDGGGGEGGDVLVFCSGSEEIATAAHALRELVSELGDAGIPPMLVLPLHASLPVDEQAKVFQAAPKGTRKVILATNVAETSLTIPNVTTVIDLGMVKQKRHDPTRGVDLLTLTTISRSAATQRAGRAGRTAPGHVYRLYTEAQLDGFETEPPPEILRTDLASALLQLKAMGISRLLSIDWLDPPEPDALTRAIKHLYLLEAIDESGNLTPTGVRMSRLPLNPPLARALLASITLRCVPACAALCAMASGEEPWCRAGRAELLENAARTRERLERTDGDHIAWLRLYCEWQALPSSPRARDEWCDASGVRARVLRTARDVTSQLLVSIAQIMRAAPPPEEPGDATSAAAEVGAMASEISASESAKCRRALGEAYYYHAAKRMRGTPLYQTLDQPSQSVAIHAHPHGGGGGGPGGGGGGSGGGSGRLYGAEYVVFSELMWAGKAVMTMASAVEFGWIAHRLSKLNDVDVESILAAEGEDHQLKKHFQDHEHGGTLGKRAAPAGNEANRAAARAKTSDEAPVPAGTRRNDSEAVSAARARFLQRKSAGHC